MLHENLELIRLGGVKGSTGVQALCTGGRGDGKAGVDERVQKRVKCPGEKDCLLCVKWEESSPVLHEHRPKATVENVSKSG